TRTPETYLCVSPTRSAPACRSGKFLGHVVTILSSRTPCAIAGLGKADAAAAAPMPAPATNWRRSMIPSRLVVRAVSEQAFLKQYRQACRPHRPRCWPLYKDRPRSINITFLGGGSSNLTRKRPIIAGARGVVMGGPE